jgi:dolichol-phosphate mannosyltransferase
MASVFLNIPILNEVENVQSLVRRLEDQLDGYDYLILLIDDGSTDGTLDKIALLVEANKRIRVLHRKKMRAGCQRGGALFEGMMWGLAHSSSTFFIEMDGDLSHRPEELSTGLSMLQSRAAEMVIASKYLPQGRTVDRPIGRRAVSAICNFSVRSLISRRVTDYSNGYRFYTRSVAGLLASYSFKYTSPIYLTEVIAILLRNRTRIGEFPTTYVGRNEGFSKLRFIDLAKASLAIFEIALRYYLFGFHRVERMVEVAERPEPKPMESR